MKLRLLALILLPGCGYPDARDLFNTPWPPSTHSVASGAGGEGGTEGMGGAPGSSQSSQVSTSGVGAGGSEKVTSASSSSSSSSTGAGPKIPGYTGLIVDIPSSCSFFAGFPGVPEKCVDPTQYMITCMNGLGVIGCSEVGPNGMDQYLWCCPPSGCHKDSGVDCLSEQAILCGPVAPDPSKVPGCTGPSLVQNTGLQQYAYCCI